MPIYEYRCASCGFEKEYLQKLSDAPITDCERCGQSAMTKLVSAAGFQLKGSGWYVTDFKNNNAKPPAKGEPKADAAQGAADTSQGAADTSQGAADTKSGESKSGDTQPSDRKSSDTRSSDTKSSDTKLAGTEPKSSAAAEPGAAPRQPAQ